MDKSSKTIQRMFDEIAPTYDSVNQRLSLSIDTLWRLKTVRALGIKKRDVILDIATGTGGLAMLALKKNAGCRIVGVDLSGKMLGLAANKRDKEGCSARYALLKGDACHMPFKENVFDHAMIGFGLRNVAHMESLFRESSRVLKKGGKLAVLEFSLPQQHFINRLYLVYFKIILPFLGGIISGKREAYRYLRDSVMAFDSPGELESRMRNLGFRIVESLPLWFGICHLYVVENTGM